MIKKNNFILYIILFIVGIFFLFPSICYADFLHDSFAAKHGGLVSSTPGGGNNSSFVKYEFGDGTVVTQYDNSKEYHIKWSDGSDKATKGEDLEALSKEHDGGNGETGITEELKNDATKRIEISYPTEAMKEDISNNLFYITVGDTKNTDKFLAWLNKKESYIGVKQYSDGNNSYFLNIPNLQQGISNFLQGMNVGGWIGNAKNYELGSSETSKTCRERYGYNIPSYTYVGELAVCNISLDSITGDSDWDKFLNGVESTRLYVEGIINSGTEDKEYENLRGDYKASSSKNKDKNKGKGDETNFANGYSPSQIQTVTYANSDYTYKGNSYKAAVCEWLEQHWWDLKDNGVQIYYKEGEEKKWIFDDDVVLKAGEDPKEVGGVAILDRIYKLKKFDVKTFLNTSIEVLKNQGIDPPKQYIIRHMPYDYSNMSYLSKGYMQGVQDPRYDMFMSGISAEFPIYLVNTTTKSFFGGLVNYFVMFPNAWLMQTSEVMDGMCTFGWIKNSGVDLTWTWKGAIGKLILGFFILYFLFSICKNIWNTISGNKTIKQVASQVIPVFLATILCIGLLMIPNKAGTAIENTVGNLLQVFSNQLDDTSEAYQQLYAGDFDSLNASQKSALKYWALYANIWSTYTTNHSLGDDSAVFDVNRGGNEYREYDTSPARLEGNTTVNLWQIALLEELLTNDELSAYRTVDHFMAPVITPGEGAEFSVSTNPNYNGYFYSEPPIFSTLLTLSVAILTFIKMLCFLELITNILLLFLKVLRYSTQQDNDINKGFTKTIQEIGWALVRTLFYDGFIFLCIFSTFNVLGSINLISIILSAVVFCYLKWLFTSGSKSVLYPKFLDLMSVVFRKAGKALKAVAPTANALASANDASDEQLNLLKKYTKANNKKLGISDDHDDAIKMRKKDNRSLNRHQATKPIRESVKQKAKNHKERKENSFLTNAASVASRINTHNPFSKNYVDKHDKELDEEERRREEEERKRKLEEEKGENKPKDKKEDKDSLLTNNSENNNKKRGDKYRKENGTNSSQKQPIQDNKANDNNRKVSSKKGNDVITPSQKQTKDVKTKQQNNSKKKPININLKEKNNDKK